MAVSVQMNFELRPEGPVKRSPGRVVPVDLQGSKCTETKRRFIDSRACLMCGKRQTDWNADFYLVSCWRLIRLCGGNKAMCMRVGTRRRFRRALQSGLLVICWCACANLRRTLRPWDYSASPFGPTRSICSRLIGPYPVFYNAAAFGTIGRLALADKNKLKVMGFSTSSAAFIWTCPLPRITKKALNEGLITIGSPAPLPEYHRNSICSFVNCSRVANKYMWSSAASRN